MAKRHDCSELLTLARYLVDHYCLCYNKSGEKVTFFNVCSPDNVKFMRNFFIQHKDLGSCFGGSDSGIIELFLYSTYGVKKLDKYVNLCLKDRQHH